MSQQAVCDAFDAHLATFRGGGDLQTEGVPYTPLAGRPYLSSRLSAYTRENTGPGPDCVMQESGSYQVNINRPSGEGRQPAGSIADKLVAFFPRALALAASGTQTISILYASAQPAMLAGDWITIPVTVSWSATEP